MLAVMIAQMADIVVEPDVSEPISFHHFTWHDAIIGTRGLYLPFVKYRRVMKYVPIGTTAINTAKRTSLNKTALAHQQWCWWTLGFQSSPQFQEYLHTLCLFKHT